MRPLEFIGRAKSELDAFPKSARKKAGFQLKFVQLGSDPADWRPMRSVGPGVVEIRLHDPSGEFRVIYVAKFADAIYVLHCFEKKSQKTSRSDIEIASARYREVVARRRS